MAERKRFPTPFPTKLTEAVAQYYPGAEILVSFPDKWQWITSFKREYTSLYVAGLPPTLEQLSSTHFRDLSPEINHSLTRYRLYKLFEPWPSQRFQVAWNTHTGEGQLQDHGRPQVQLRPIGQAQAWTGNRYGLLWEAYLFDSQQQPYWMDTLGQFWQAVEQDMRVDTIFTQPHEPTFSEGYTDFLSRLGYGPDPDFAGWWRKAG